MKKLFVLIAGVALSILSAVAQQKAEVIDSLYLSAVKAAEKGDYKRAFEDMSKVRDMAENNESIKTDAVKFLNRIDKFEVTPQVINVSSIGDFHELTIISVGNWKCDDLPTWCKIEENSENYLKIWFEPNAQIVSRSGYIKLSNENGKLEEILVHQDKGSDKSGMVLFRTIPHNTRLAIPGQSVYSATPLELGLGEFNVSVSKPGYTSRDTTLILNDVLDTTMIVDMELEPLFGRIKPVVVDMDGKPWLNSDISKLNFTIRNHSVDISDYVNSFSYDDEEGVRYYGFYKDGTIPVLPDEDKYVIEVSAPGYRTFKTTIDVEHGGFYEIKIPMKSIIGKLTIKAEDKNAVGADVRIPELYVLSKVGETLELVEGTYGIEVHKDGYQWDNEIREIQIKEGENLVYEVMMTRQVDMYVSAEGGNEEIYLNGKRVRDNHYKLNEGEDYELEVRKDGYWHFYKEFRVSDSDTLFNFKDLKLEKTGVLSLKSDEKNLSIKLIRKETPDGLADLSGFDYAENKKLSMPKEYTEFVVPQGKYNVVLTRNDIKSTKRKNMLAYKGVIKFDEPAEKKNLRTWMKPRLGSVSVLSVDYSLGYKANIASGKIPTPLRANIFELPLMKGLSTSVAEGAMIYTHGRNDFPKKLPLDHYTVVMPAISGPLMNYDFRIGGGFCQWGDISALLSYTYYFQFENIVKTITQSNRSTYYGTFDHFEGHDLFLGVELSSRIKGITGYFRAGLQHLNGNRCYTYDNPVLESNENDYWYTTSVSYVDMIKTKQTSFVITVGFDFGWTKGHNILRVF